MVSLLDGGAGRVAGTCPRGGDEEALRRKESRSRLCSTFIPLIYNVEEGSGTPRTILEEPGPNPG